MAQLRSVIDVDADVFLLTVEDISKRSELALSHIDSEIIELYKDYFEITLAHVQRMEDLTENASIQEYHVDQKVYQMIPRPLLI